MNRRSIALGFAMFFAGFIVNFGTLQLMRASGLDQYASVSGLVLGTLSLMIVHAAGSRWAGRNASSN